MRAAHATRTEVALRLDQIAPRPGEGALDDPDGRADHQKPRLHGLRLSRRACQPQRPSADRHAGRVAGGEPRERAGRPRGKVPNLLGGIVRCAACRYVLAPGRTHFGGRDVPNYRCRRLHTAAPVRHRRASMQASSSATWSRSGASRWPQRPWPYSTTQKACRMPQSSSHSPRRKLSAFAADTTARRLLGSGYTRA